MKRLTLVLTLALLVVLSLACSPGGLTGAGSPAPAGEADTPGASGSGASTPPPWFAPDPDCQMWETSVSSSGSPYAFDSAGNITELLPDGQVTCVLEIQICGDTIFKQQVVHDASEDCPPSLHYSYAPPTQVCCARWDEAKQTGSPCQPLQDADCDGVLNDADAYPLDFARQ
ncbi:MAG: hypothetical protein Kow0063_23680 [Anaerolineae bacterium]